MMVRRRTDRRHGILTDEIIVIGAVNERAGDIKGIAAIGFQRNIRQIKQSAV